MVPAQDDRKKRLIPSYVGRTRLAAVGGSGEALPGEMPGESIARRRWHASSFPLPPQQMTRGDGTFPRKEATWRMSAQLVGSGMSLSPDPSSYSPENARSPRSNFAMSAIEN